MAVTTRVIDLGAARDGEDFPAYAAVYCPAGTDNPFVLSPEAMRWSENIYLSRLDACRHFWLEHKKKRCLKLGQLFDSLLSHHHGDNFAAVMGRHPWQCLLLLHYQRRHARGGCHLLHGRLNQNIYRRLDWEHWFAPQDRLAAHLEALPARGFRRDSFAVRQAQLRRFIDRIAVPAPSRMSAAGANSMARRFGRWLGRIWSWTHTDSSDLQGFPWIRHVPSPLPRICRDLDYPVNDWNTVEQLLREDFGTLCAQFPSHDSEHVNRISWQITLFNYRKMPVELSFRHPYSLHRDRPDYNTALYQARYVYDDLMRKLETREQDLDLPQSMPFLGWRIEISERLMLTPALWDLFAGESDEIDYRQVLALQNKLPRALEHYRAAASFIPEKSFQPLVPGGGDAPLDTYPWACAATNKPLFYYPEAQPIEPPPPAATIFLERNAAPWWRGDDPMQTRRDYFRLRDRRGRASWVYRDASGAWFRQGEFL